MWFGIREHAMGAICNGIAYDGLFLPSGATFCVFADYLRPAIRLAALAKLPTAFILHSRLSGCRRRWTYSPACRDGERPPSDP